MYICMCMLLQFFNKSNMKVSVVHAAACTVSVCLLVCYCVLQLSTSNWVGLGTLPYVPVVRYPTQRLRVPPNLHKTLHQCRKPLVISTITDIVTLAAFLQSDWDSTAVGNQCMPLSLVNQTIVAVTARQPSPLCYCMQRQFADYVLFTMAVFGEWDSSRDVDAQPVEPIVDLAVWQRHMVGVSNTYKSDVYTPAVEACIRATRVVAYDMVWGNYNIYCSAEGVLTLLAYAISVQLLRAHDALAVRTIYSSLVYVCGSLGFTCGSLGIAVPSWLSDTEKNVSLLSAFVHLCMVGLLIPTLLLTGLGQCVLMLCYFASLIICESAVLLYNPYIRVGGPYPDHMHCAFHSWRERVRLWHHQTVLVTLLCVLHNLAMLYLSMYELVCDMVLTGSAVALVYVVYAQGALLVSCTQQYAEQSIRSNIVFNTTVCAVLAVCKGLWVEGSHLDLMGLRSRGTQIWMLKVLYILLALAGDAIPSLCRTTPAKGQSTCACMSVLQYSGLMGVTESGLLLYLSAVYLTTLYT